MPNRSVSTMDTKTRILNAAFEQFSRRGFEGASIRDIASEANVNVAAINYHFKNKQNLYWANYMNCYQRIEQTTRTYFKGKRSMSLEQVVSGILEIFQKHSHSVVNVFKLFLSESVPEPDGDYRQFCESICLMPPGSQILKLAIAEHIKKRIDPGQVDWAIKCIYMNIVHLVLMGQSAHIKKIKAASEEYKSWDIEHFVKLHARAILTYLNDSTESTC